MTTTSLGQSCDTNDGMRHTRDILISISDSVQEYITGNPVEADASDLNTLRRLQRQVERLKLTDPAGQSVTTSAPSSTIDGDEFLDIFMRNAFPEQMEQIRQSEGESMSGEDLLTLAQSIRNFGRAVDSETMELLRESVVDS